MQLFLVKFKNSPKKGRTYWAKVCKIVVNYLFCRNFMV